MRRRYIDTEKRVLLTPSVRSPILFFFFFYKSERVCERTIKSYTENTCSAEGTEGEGR